MRENSMAEAECKGQDVAGSRRDKCLYDERSV